MAKESSRLYTAKYLVEELNISDKYLRRIMTNLSKAELVKSVQGRDGGYKFAKETSQIYLLDIVSAVDVITKYTGCVLGFENCSESDPCAIHHKWKNSRDYMLEIFTSFSLDQIVAGNLKGKI